MVIPFFFFNHKWTILLDEWLGSFLLPHLLAMGMRSWGWHKRTAGTSVITISIAFGGKCVQPNHILYLKALLWGHIEEIHVSESASWDSPAERFSLLEANELLGPKQRHVVLLPLRRWHISRSESSHFPSCICSNDIQSQVITPSVRKPRDERVWKIEGAERKSLWLGMTGDDSSKARISESGFNNFCIFQRTPASG